MFVLFKLDVRRQLLLPVLLRNAIGRCNPNHGNVCVTYAFGPTNHLRCTHALLVRYLLKSDLDMHMEGSCHRFSWE